MYIVCSKVLFLGKIKSSHKRAPPTFIDDAIKKFKQREEKLRGGSCSSNGSPAAVSKVVTNDGGGGAPVCHPLDDVFKGKLQVIFTPNLKRFNLDDSKSCQSGDPPAPGSGERSERSAAGQQLLLQEQDDAAADRADRPQAHITRHQAGGLLVWS